MSEERDRLAEEFSKAYLNDIACADLSYSRSIDIEIGFKAGFDAGVESERKKQPQVTGYCSICEAREKKSQALVDALENMIDLFDGYVCASDMTKEHHSALRGANKALAAYNQESSKK